VLVCEQSGEAAIVDAPRWSRWFAAWTRSAARHQGALDPPSLDHSGANPELAKCYDAPVFGHVSDANRIPGFTDGLRKATRSSRT
jgi:hypothetical protein